LNHDIGISLGKSGDFEKDRRVRQRCHSFAGMKIDFLIVSALKLSTGLLPAREWQGREIVFFTAQYIKPPHPEVRSEAKPRRTHNGCAFKSHFSPVSSSASFKARQKARTSG
jgi:hypothetical protein